MKNGERKFCELQGDEENGLEVKTASYSTPEVQMSGSRSLAA